MVVGVGTVSLQCDSSPMFGTVEKVGEDSSKSVTTTTADTNSQSPIYVRYKDHVIFKNIPTPSAAPVIRETIGWVKEQNDELLLIEHDRAIPSQGKSVNGIIILKNCILEVYVLPLQNNSEWVLSSRETKSKVELAFRPSERKTHGAKDSQRKSQTC